MFLFAAIWMNRGRQLFATTLVMLLSVVFTCWLAIIRIQSGSDTAGLASGIALIALVSAPVWFITRTRKRLPDAFH
jgi:hypothetical protein